MTMRDWYGVIALLVTVGGALLLAWLLLRHSSRKGDSSGNIEYDKLVMSAILPSNHGISIDKVYEAVKDTDFTEFHLDVHPTGDEQQ